MFRMNVGFACVLAGFMILCFGLAAPGAEIVVIRPAEYAGALRNPMKGFTNRGFREHNPWATLVHSYIRWNQIENDESDGIDKIRDWCDAEWQGVSDRNQKVIPRVYLHWSGDRKYWPADMTPDDYTSDQFVARVTRLVKRLGICWDTDPRVAHVELGLIGKWGEHHSPAPTPEIERLLGRAFEAAFVHTQVLVRHPWQEFKGHGFGGYWDSWAHASQMDSHGQGMASLGDRWRTSLIGGETAYDWGRYKEQPGDSPTDTVSDPVHRQFLIDTIRSLHCTQLRWVSDYDQANVLARVGAEAVQKAFGYRYVLQEIHYPRQIEQGDPFEVTFNVINTGSAPFYYDWPVELSLLDRNSNEPVWRGVFEGVDIRSWMPGDQWNPTAQAYTKPAIPNTGHGVFEVNDTVKTGTYVLAIAVLDPAGQVPSLRLATRNYQQDGRHPLGFVGVGVRPRVTQLDPTGFDDPKEDQTLHYLENL
ncbi:MAG: DUF4832 domain-containing protein [Planctomycetes bacterium]|nr:DUF4832 domain-containing protein [Planctomycetota bacterium]